MGRPQSSRWQFFEKVSSPSGMKTARAKCLFCKKTVSASARNMDTHYRNCRSVKRTIGALLPTNQSSQDPVSPSSQPTSNTANESETDRCGSKTSACIPQTNLRGPLSQLIGQQVKKGKKNDLNLLFARAIHETATSFSFFDRPVWHEFFGTLNPCWYPPSPLSIGGELLDDSYKATMKSVIDIITKCNGGVLGVDGATNRLAKSVSNVIVHTPTPFFIEYLRADLKRETTVNVVAKLEDTIKRIDESTSIRTIFSFVSDSCNGMRDVRKRLLQKKLVKWEYGCASHCLHNLSCDIGQLDPFKELTKKAVYVSKSVKNTGMIRKLYDSLCTEKYGKPLVMKLFSPTRWTSCNEMFKRLIRVRPALTLMSHAILNERESRQIDTDFKLPSRLEDILKDPSFWSGINTAISVLNPIAACLGLLESDTCTMSDAYASFIFMRAFIKCSCLTPAQKQQIDVKLLYRWNRIYSPVHALAFACDPFYSDLRTNFSNKYGVELMELGKGAFNGQCHEAINLLSKDTAHNKELMVEFMRYTLSKDAMLASLNSFRTQLVWGQLNNVYPCLSVAMAEVYCAPSSTAAVERNHKTGKAVLCQQRCRLHDLAYQRQVCVAYNGHQVKKRIAYTRGEGFDKHLQTFCEKPTTTMITKIEDDDDAFDFSDMEEDILMLETSLANVESPHQIPDDILFIHPSD